MIAARFPFSNLDLFRGEVDRLFEDFFAAPGSMGTRQTGRMTVFPALNVWDNGDELVAEAELPGLSIENLDISLMGSELTIRGKRESQNGKDTACHRQERGSGEFARTVALPYPVNSDAVDAAMKDGILTIKMPKAESAKPRKIEVKTQ